MSASRILAQAVPCLLNSFPGWRQPVHVKLKAVMNGSAAWVVDEDETTPGLSVSGATGVYVVTFPAGKHIASVHADVWPAAPETDAQNRKVSVDPDSAETFANEAANPEGQITLYTQDLAGAETAPVENSELHVDFWVDYG